MEITFFPDQGSNPGRLRDRLTLYRVDIKAGLYRKAVQVYNIPIPGDILPLQLEIRPWISRSPRITWNETRTFMHTCGLFTLGAKCNRWKNGNNIFPDRGSNPGRLRDRLTLYRVAIKAGLYRKAVQVYHIPIPGGINKQL